MRLILSPHAYVFVPRYPSKNPEVCQFPFLDQPARVFPGGV